jgi:pimeloyl-ACP methyl ester carboxylesterase
MRTVWTDVGGVRMHALTCGRGRPVALVHGFGVSGDYMLPLARELAPHARVLVPDLPGQGKSDQNGSHGIGELAEKLGTWLGARRLRHPVLVANSMGCQVVTYLATERPDRVGPLVLIGPTVDPARRGAPRQIAAALRDAAREPYSLLGIAARDNAGAGLSYLLAMARSALADRIEDRLPKIEQEVVVVFGETDGFVSREWAEQVTALLPRGRLVVAPGEPHAVHYTRPDLVADIVRDLLVEEREDAIGELSRRLEHRHVSALHVDNARTRDQLLPLRGDSCRDEAVALAPDE